MRGRAISWTLAAFALTATALGCNLALGLPDYEDAALQVCGCPGVALLFSDCTTRVHDALQKADKPDREAWLSTFAAEDCTHCNADGSNYAICLQTEPVCRAAGEACSKVLDCCGAIFGTGYCFEGTCRVEAPSCKHAFDACTTDEECCGFEAGLGKCYDSDKSKVCFEFCATPDLSENCPNCCTHVENPGLPKSDICIDGPTAAVALEAFTLGATTCQSGCNLGVDEDCPSGTTCQRLDVGGGTTLHYCVP